METQLVVLGVDHPFVREGVNPAQTMAQTILDARGNGPRLFKNALVFLAPDRTRLAELDDAVRLFLAWDSIEKDKDELGLDGFQVRQVVNQKGTWNTAVKGRLAETFCWLIYPAQPTPQATLEWQSARLNGPDPLAVRVSKKLRSDTQMASQYAPTLLRHDLDKIPLWRGEHVPVKQLVEDYAKYPYLQRLRGPDVLAASIQDGLSRTTWTTETFAIADSWEEKQQRYVGLRGICQTRIEPDSTALLVKPDIAVRQMEADSPPPAPSPGLSGVPTAGGAAASQGTVGSTEVTTTATPAEKPRRFYGTVKLDPARLNRDAAQVSAEVVQHLTALLGSEVEVTLEIQASVPGGIPDNIVRTVSENCRTLKFENQGFEQE